jgi:uncharacterized protein DUF4352
VTRTGTILGCLVLGGISLLGTLALLNRRDERVGLGTEIRYDDFRFAALSARRAPAAGTLAPENGLFLIVTLRVSNRAKVVDYRFRTESAVLVDGRGGEWRPSAEATAALRAAEGKGDPFATELAPGESREGEFVYDVPADLRRPELRFSWGGSVAEALTLAFDGRKRIALE